MFEILNKIGKGSSSNVYEVFCKNDKNIYALKQSLSKESDDLLKNEISIYKIFKNNCPYIIKFYNSFKSKNEHGKNCFSMQIEFCQFGSIRDIIKIGRKKGIQINELEISSIIYMVLKGIEFMHKKELVNRDIKGRNILINNLGDVKLCDFGICKHYIKNKMKELRGGSPYWMAPEILRKEEYNQSIDIWALGITCIEFAEYEPPYSKYDPTDVIKQIIKKPPNGLSNPQKWSNCFNDFISRCLEIDKFKRPLTDELLKHEFINIIEKKNLNRRLIILQFLSKCGYNVIYSKKTKLISLTTNFPRTIRSPLIKSAIKINMNKKIINSNNRNQRNKKLIRMNSLDNIKQENKSIRINNSNIEITNNSNSNLNLYKTINTSSISTTTNNLSKTKNRISLIPIRSYNVFKKKIFIHHRSSEKKIAEVSKKKTDFKKYFPYLTAEENKKSNMITQNNKENSGSYLDKDEENTKQKFMDMEIKNLIHERNQEINNILLKYQDKIAKIKTEKQIFRNSFKINNFKERVKKEQINLFNDNLNNTIKINRINNKSPMTEENNKYTEEYKINDN